MGIEFVLPYPPTVNTYWRRRGSTYFVSKAGERYRRDVALIVRQQRLKLNLSGRLAIKIIAEPPDKRRRDLDNILKAPLDALTHAGLLIDDEQFDEVNIMRSGCSRWSAGDKNHRTGVRMHNQYLQFVREQLTIATADLSGATKRSA